MRYSGERGELFAATGRHPVRQTNRMIAVVRRRIARILMLQLASIRAVMSPLLAREPVGERESERAPVLDDAFLPMFLRGRIGITVVEQVEYRGGQIESGLLM